MRFWSIVLAGAWAVSMMAAETVPQWGIYEIVLNGPTNGNPFIDVRLSAVFDNGSKKVEVAGFYDGDGVYRIRFMPDEQGVWRYETEANRWPLTRQVGSFEVGPPAKGRHGPVRVHNTYHFAYADGTLYYPIGTTIYNWLQAPDDWQELTLNTLSNAPFNKVRFLVTPQDVDFRKSAPATLFPFEGRPRNEWDFTRFSPPFFRKLEQRIAQLGDLGIEADVILFHPYGKTYGFDTMDPETDERYIRYIVARLSAYHNVWWSLANEYDFLRTKTEADWHRFFQIVQEADPYGHLRSIHNGYDIYNNSLPWVTHASIQNGSAVTDPGRAVLYRDVWRKPVVFDEVKYEGTENYRWGQLTPEEMTHRMWAGLVAGTYVQHGECYLHADDTWLSYGGVLRGESWKRIAFLRQILEDAPPGGLDPVDKWQDWDMGGRSGVYYLKYFGWAAPTNWTFELPREGLQEGMQFRVDVIDTWNMTITPVDGVFTLKRKDRYSFVDGNGRAVKLPGKPGIAVRIRNVGGSGPGSRGMAPVEPF
ncbi:MAG TPA: DUF5060 domain-containing protein [Verrucomicrobiota bacterium]|nr:DUF5060 domain-containing protein [Verrucomicrobiota bacterium]